MSALNKPSALPMILGVADSTHYLVGMIDNGDNFTPLLGSSDIAVLDSLVEAKRFLTAHHINKALLEYQTPYDEMCGMQTAVNYRQTIEF